MARQTDRPLNEFARSELVALAASWRGEAHAGGPPFPEPGSYEDGYNVALLRCAQAINAVLPSEDAVA